MEPSSYLIISCVFVFAMRQRAEGSSPCHFGPKIPRGMEVRASLNGTLTIACPVQRCGETPNVGWCKLERDRNCDSIRNEGHVEISDKETESELISYLTLRGISVHDAGLYRCSAIGENYQAISHTINISVSDMRQEEEPTVTSSAKCLTSPHPDLATSPAPNPEPESRLLYGVIGGCTFLLVSSLSAFIGLPWLSACKEKMHHRLRGGEVMLRKSSANSGE